MDDILRLRNRIDEIDQEIVQLLKNRHENARLLGQIKKARGLGLRDPKREKAILKEIERVAQALNLEPALVRSIFRRIFTLAVQAQKDSTGKTARELEGRRVLVVGGTGGMGRFFAHLAHLHGGSVKIVGRSSIRTRKVAGEMEVQAGSMLDARTSDIVVVATPMESTRRVALRLAEQMKEGSLLTDLSSVKTGIADEIAKKIPQGIEYVSLHPLFSPEVDHVQGQTIAAVPFKAGPVWRRFSRTLEIAGARIQVCSFHTHDMTMSYVQAIHHFALLSLGVSLSKWDGRLGTNSLRVSEDRIRSLLRNWDTIMGIQRLNPYARSARHEFVSVAGKLERMNLSDVRASKRILESDVQKWARKT